jgi:hypothetical protein
MDYFSRKSLSKYLIFLINTIDFNKHDVDIFINGTWQKYAGNIYRMTLQNYMATWTSLLANEKSKSTFTRQLLRPLTWALLLVLFKNLQDGKNINQSNCKKQTRLNLFRTSENLKRTCLPTHFLHWLGSNWKRRTIN